MSLYSLNMKKYIDIKAKKSLILLSGFRKDKYMKKLWNELKNDGIPVRKMMNTICPKSI